MDFELTRRGLEIGALELRFYSLAILLGLLGGIVLAQREAKRRGENPEHVLNIATLGAFAGIVGARLYHVLDAQNIRGYLDNPILIFQVWRGGIGIFGAIAGASLALILYARWKRLNAWRWFDIGAPAFLLGQAIGRWGNFFNEELFGRPTSLPWGIPVSAASRPFDYPASFFPDMRFHPLFLYESILSFIGVAVLLYAARRYAHWLRPGDLLWLYLIWYSAERFLLEFLRIDPWTVGPIPMAQIVSVLLVAVAGALMYWRHRQPVPVVAEAEDQEPRRSRASEKRLRRRMGAE
ncbi:MAG: prolipoprotein diacylglyceryl transferase [SAR202 cluster bacterium]|nr:prolipoprotein diacylglyceryl transferase [SAR202 cluster bacterium]